MITSAEFEIWASFVLHHPNIVHDSTLLSTKKISLPQAIILLVYCLVDMMRSIVFALTLATASAFMAPKAAPSTSTVVRFVPYHAADRRPP